MALITCAECNKKISETTNNCPKCGAQITAEMIAEGKKKSLQEKKISKGCGAGCLVTIVVLILIGFFMGDKNGTDAPTISKAPITPLIAKTNQSPENQEYLAKQDRLIKLGYENKSKNFFWMNDNGTIRSVEFSGNKILIGCMFPFVVKPSNDRILWGAVANQTINDDVLIRTLAMFDEPASIAMQETIDKQVVLGTAPNSASGTYRIRLDKGDKYFALKVNVSSDSIMMDYELSD